MPASLTPAEVAEMLRGPQPPRLLDVRQPEEHALVALPGAKLVPLTELAARAQDLAAWRNEKVVVYCHHGMRSQRAAALLEQLGFREVFNLEGGIERWAVEVDPSLPRY